MSQAIEQYLDYHAWKLDRVAEGIAAADQRDIVSHDDLFERLRDRYRTKPR